MMRMKTSLVTLCSVLAIVFCSVRTSAQLAGTISVPNATYPTLASVVSALNAQGVGTGGATVNLTAAQTAPAGGYVLGSATLNASLSAANPLVLNGGNQTITAFTGTSTSADGVIKLAGTDYVTIQNFTIQEAAANTTATTYMEWGVALVKRSATAPFDGCQNVKVLNNTISLSRLNANAVGVYLGNHIATATTALAITAATDANSNNTIAGNSISNVYQGIWLSGYNQTAAPYSLYDQNNVVGGSTAAAGNTIENYAGGTATTGYGVYLIYQNGSTVRNNNIDNDAGTGGIAGRTTLYGIFHSTGNSSATNISNNTVSLTMGSTITSSFYAVNCAVAGAAASAVLSRNTISGTGGSSAAFYGIYSTGSLQDLSMDSNIVSGMVISSTGANYLIYNASTATGVVNMRGNSIFGVTKTSATGLVYCIYANASSTATSTFTIANNSVTNVNIAPSSGVLRGIYDENNAATGFPVKQVYGNTISNLTTGAGIVFGIRVEGLGSNATNGTSAVYNNTVSGLTNASTLYGIYTAATETANVYGNTVSGLLTSGASSVVNGIYHSGGAGSVLSSYRNRVYDITAAGTTSPEVDGLYATAGAGGLVNLYNNFISDLKAPTGSANDAFFGIFLAGATTDFNIYHNTVRLNPVNTGTNFGGAGLHMAGTATASNTIDVRNNIFNVNATASGTGMVAAMRRAGGTAGTAPAAYAQTSNGNILYAPNAANTYLYAEGATAAAAVNTFSLANDPGFNTTCGLYKAFMAPRDNGTFTENNLSPIAGMPGTFAPTGSSFASNNALPTTAPAVTTDYFGITRGTAADIGAAEFSGSGADVAGPAISYTSLPASTLCAAPPTLTASITDAASGVNTASGTAPRLYFKKSSEANAFGGANNSTFNGWKWVEATGAAPNFSFTPDYSLLTAPIASGDVIQYFVVAQDNAGTPNVSSVTAAYPAGFCPTSVALPAGAGPLAANPAPDFFTIGTTPTTLTATASPEQICVSGPVTLSLSGPTTGLSVQWQSAVFAGTFSNISGATTAPATVPNVTVATRYRAVVSCGGNVLFTTNEDTVVVQSPAVLSTTAPPSQCGGGTFTLNATGSAGTMVKWYAAASGGAPLATGPSFTTPFISNTTTYYAAAVTANGGTENVPSPTPGTSTFITTTAGWGLRFTVNAPVTINTVNIKASATTAGTASIQIKVTDLADVVLYTGTAHTFAIGTTLTVYTVPVNITLPPGNYKMAMTYSGITNLVRESGGVTFPYTAPSNAVSITAGANGAGTAQTTTSYYWFYNWVVSSGCESPRTPVTATVTPPATATATASGSTAICQGSSVTLNASPTGAGYNYQWLLNGLPIAGATSASYSASQPGGYTVSVFTTPACNDTNNTPIVVTVSAVPTSVSPAGPVTLCTGGSQVITGPAGTGLTYQWLLNNAPIPSATNATYTATATGAYRVRVTTSNGCSDTSQPVVINVVSAPPSSITASGPLNVCPNVGVILSGPVNSSLSYQWYLNGTIISGATGQTYTALTAGQYTLRTQVTGANCSTFSSPVVVTTSPLPPTAFTASNGGNICAGSTVTLTGPVDLGYSYQWLLNGAPIVGANAQSYTTATAGSYRLKVTAFTTGCIDTSGPTVLTARPLPPAITTPTGSGEICFGTTRTLTANSGSGLTYQWLFNTLPVAGATAQSYAAASSGQYSVRVTSSFGCVNTSSPYTLTVRPQPPGQISYTDPLQFCAGGAVVLTAAGGTPGITYQYQWFRNGVGVPASNTPFLQVTQAGLYTLTAQDALGCQATSPAVTVTVNPTPSVIISASGAVLTANPGFYPQYQWYLNNVAIVGANTSTYTATQNGSYRVEVVDDNGCLGQSTTLYLTSTGVAGVAPTSAPIVVYPNPTSSVLRIEAPLTVNAYLRNSLGQTVLIQKDATSMDVTRFPDGLYTLMLTDREGNVVYQEKVSKLSR